MFHRDIQSDCCSTECVRYLTVNILELVKSTDCKQRWNFEIKFTVLSVYDRQYIATLSASCRIYTRMECTFYHIILPASGAL